MKIEQAILAFPWHIHRSGAASPAWTPLVAGGVQDWQTSQTATGLRLWGIGAFESDTHLKYVDVAG